MIRAIIIDDEEDSRESLRLLIEKYCPSVQLISICNGPQEGLAAIKKEKPELVFLDVQMPHISGFDLLDEIGNPDFQVIFVTAHDHYAIKAIRFSALDYLLKPVDKEDLISAVERYSLNKSESGINYEEILHNLRNQFGKGGKLAVPTSTGLDFVQLADIIYCQAEGSYTHLFLKGQKKTLVSKSLKEFEKILDQNTFCRVHHSAIININHVEKYLKGEGGVAIMSDGSHVDISRRKKEEFMKLISKL